MVLALAGDSRNHQLGGRLGRLFRRCFFCGCLGSGLFSRRLFGCCLFRRGFCHSFFVLFQSLWYFVCHGNLHFSSLFYKVRLGSRFYFSQMLNSMPGYIRTGSGTPISNKRAVTSATLIPQRCAISLRFCGRPVSASYTFFCCSVSSGAARLTASIVDGPLWAVSCSLLISVPSFVLVFR